MGDSQPLGESSVPRSLPGENDGLLRGLSFGVVSLGDGESGGVHPLRKFRAVLRVEDKNVFRMCWGGAGDCHWRVAALALSDEGGSKERDVSASYISSLTSFNLQALPKERDCPGESILFSLAFSLEGHCYLSATR